MGYTIKQKIDICLKAESNPKMTQSDLAQWAMHQYGSQKPPSQTTISRILASKNDIIASKEGDYKLVRRRKQMNPQLRKILTEWITQLIWEHIPITTPIIQSTAHNIWTMLPSNAKSGNGVFNQKWCAHFLKKLNVNITGTSDEIKENFGYPLNRVWKLDEKIELKQYLGNLVKYGGYTPRDIFVIDDFQLFYSLPLDQIFDVSSLDKGLHQCQERHHNHNHHHHYYCNHHQESSNEDSLTILLGCNIDGSEKLTPLIVGKYEKFDVSKSSFGNLQNISYQNLPQHQLMNKITEAYNIIYKSNSNKWITSQMFQNYLLTLDHKIQNLTPNRQILLILDDCSTHRIINVKFDHIKLIYLKNETSHKNPYNTAYSGVKFDYLPMNFGIIEEFKIFYRIQQYSALISLQKDISRKNNCEAAKHKSLMSSIEMISSPSSPSPSSSSLPPSPAPVSPALEVLSEHDYHIPLIRVIEWIKKSWMMVSQERIYHSWKRTHLLNFKLNEWAHIPSRPMINQLIQTLENKLFLFDEHASYIQLEELMTCLNVVIPWEIDELIGLVNERGKVTLSYASIEEIIGSCLSEPRDESIEDDEEIDFDDPGNTGESMVVNEHPSAPWSLSETDIDSASSLIFNKALADTNEDDININLVGITGGQRDNVGKNSSVGGSNGGISSQPSENASILLPKTSPENYGFNGSLKHKLPPVESCDVKKNNRGGAVQSFNFTSPNSINFQQLQQQGQHSHSHQLQHQHQQQQQQQFPTMNLTPPQQQRDFDIDMMNDIIRLLDYSLTSSINLSQSTIDDLNYNLKVIQNRLNHNP
ncbi:PDC2 [Candida oxycetoniae]|uniref:PDC2 n=1 Tax=Candida oxycetoniae TaxID=497107 RepID=A0AAI9SUM5_9ASCO|nr:PDC2 [Candida oxycetoniae]KAI3403004.2 PDC2 [Candida oxycetoniae]